MPNTNAQTIHQMGNAINSVVRQATGRDAVGNIDMDFVTVAQNKTVLSVSDSVPYLRRNTGGGVNIGNATLARDKIIGGTVAWNQLLRYNRPTSTDHDITYTNNNDGSWTVSGTASEDANYIMTNDPSCPKDHIILYSYDAESSSGNYRIGDFSYGGSIVGNNRTAIVLKRTSGGNFNIGVKVYSGKTVNITITPQVFDLTAMFGSAIADYILSLETAHAGDGVAYFRKLFPAPYYEYNSGELLSVEGLQSHKTTGDGWERTYPLDSSLTLRGIPKLDSNNKPYYDGDEYSPDGTVTRKYGVVDLGTLTWTKNATNATEIFRYTATVPGMKPGTSPSVIGNIICAKYPTVTAYTTYLRGMGISLETGSTAPISIYDPVYEDGESAEALKTSLSGVLLVYELATPTTETATPYTDPQEVSASGTEEYATNSIIPVGHDTDYLELVEI